MVWVNRGVWTVVKGVPLNIPIPGGITQRYRAEIVGGVLDSLEYRSAGLLLFRKSWQSSLPPGAGVVFSRELTFMGVSVENCLGVNNISFFLYERKNVPDFIELTVRTENY